MTALCLSRIPSRLASSLASSSFFLHNRQCASPRQSRAVTQTLPPRLLDDGFRRAQVLTPTRLLSIYAQLSKARLTTLVVLTAMSGVALSPLPATVPVLLSTALGTALCSASANTLNQLQEVPLDAQMARTRMRPLVRRAISPLHAAAFALLTGTAGPALLCTMATPTSAAIGAANIALYSGLYTYLKRTSVLNTWVGALVGALPPLIGWSACGGPLLDPAPLALFLLHFSWQFPHFNGLSHLIRDAYAQAGYRMLSVLSPRKNALVALRHALLLVPISSVLVPLSGLTTWAFALTSLVPNAVCLRAAWMFWKRAGDKQARAVFQHSLWYLPVMLALMMLHKQGVDWFSWAGWTASPEDEEEVDEGVQH